MFYITQIGSLGVGWWFSKFTIPLRLI
jgi:hypothetical protein